MLESLVLSLLIFAHRHRYDIKFQLMPYMPRPLTHCGGGG